MLTALKNVCVRVCVQPYVQSLQKNGRNALRWQTAKQTFTT